MQVGIQRLDLVFQCVDLPFYCLGLNRNWRKTSGEQDAREYALHLPSLVVAA